MGVRVRVRVHVDVRVGVGVHLDVRVGVDVHLDVHVGVDVHVDVRVGVDVQVDVRVGVDVCGRRDWEGSRERGPGRCLPRAVRHRGWQDWRARADGRGVSCR